jgi:serine/threonine protein kinase
MEKNIEKSNIAIAIRYAIEKKYAIAPLSFDGSDGDLTETMKQYADEKNFDIVFSYDYEKIEVDSKFSGTPVQVNGKLYSKESGEWLEDESENISALFYVHDKGVQLLSLVHGDLSPESILTCLNNVDKYLSDDGFDEEEEKFEKESQEPFQQ